MPIRKEKRHEAKKQKEMSEMKQKKFASKFPQSQEEQRQTFKDKINTMRNNKQNGRRM
ncbi:MAG: hypothetical protein K0T99_02775 [Alphaproteobacteria bacterium]|nr:hypothetical protein [Alphaproteobacteria bacterium]